MFTQEKHPEILEKITRTIDNIEQSKCIKEITKLSTIKSAANTSPPVTLTISPPFTKPAHEITS